MKRERNLGGPRATGVDEFWCSDCIARSLFERVADAAVGEEWACTACGAAYFDAVELVVEPNRARMRGASARRSA